MALALHDAARFDVFRKSIPMHSKRAIRDSDTDIYADIYAGATVPERMSELMEKVGRLFDANSSFMFTSHSAHNPDAILLGQNLCPRMVDGFRDYWSTEDVWALAAARKGMMRRNVVVTGTELVPVAELQRSRFYNEFGRDCGMGRMLGSVLFDGAESDAVALPFTNLCWYKAPGRDDFSRDDVRRLRHLLPHFQQALRIQHRLRALQLQANVEVASSGAFGIASVLLDESGRILDLNPLAAAQVESRESVLHSSGGRLKAIGQRCSPSVHEALAHCKASGRAVRIMAQSADRHQLIKASLQALPADTETLAGTNEQRRFLLLLEIPRNAQRDVIESAARLFGFTQAEQEIVLGLLDGLNAEQIAAMRCISMNTVRTQLRSVLAKTQMTRQIDLVRMLVRLT